MNKLGYKTFLDTVHGYITVPEAYCDKLIDTENFQRLRRIEQLSSRSLFPCARHDRFVHSLGVYHIGCKFVTAIERQHKNLDKSVTNSFLMACLLHDCGHSPFSHTLEHLFGKPKDLFAEYKEIDTDEELQQIDIEAAYDTKPHEIISSILCMTTYRQAIKDLGGDPSLIGRMIMGIKYNDALHSLHNCFIELLHGDIIDADKFDYICRDKWASGYQSNSVDVDRVINSIILVEKDNQYKIAYSKSALYEIQALIDNKNFQSNWVFKHRQVVYEQKILKDCVQKLIECLREYGVSQAKELFNYRAFFEVVEVCPEISVYMLSDDDIVHLMKKYLVNDPLFREWMSRQYSYFPIWKTYSEMKALLGEELSEKLLNDVGILYDKIETGLKEKYHVDVFSIEQTPKMKGIESNQIFIYFNRNTVVDFVNLGMPKVQNPYKEQLFKYIFIHKNTKCDRNEIIALIRDIIKMNHDKYNR